MGDNKLSWDMSASYCLDKTERRMFTQWQSASKETRREYLHSSSIYSSIFLSFFFCALCHANCIGAFSGKNHLFMQWCITLSKIRIYLYFFAHKDVAPWMQNSLINYNIFSFSSTTKQPVCLYLCVMTYFEHSILIGERQPLWNLQHCRNFTLGRIQYRKISL